MIFDFQTSIADELRAWIRPLSPEERRDCKENRVPRDLPRREFDPTAAATQSAIASVSYATLIGTGERDMKELAEARRGAWRDSVKPLDCAAFQDIYHACWSLPDSVASLPRYSFLIRFRFKLATPLLTKDDGAFYAIENPVRKDRTFGVPCLAASSWKGCFRAALRRRGHGEESLVTVRLCGNKPGEPDHAKSRRGRLEFFSTKFEGLGFEVLNPHDRIKKTGMPVYYESVPAGTSGEFCLLYVPFNGLAVEGKELMDEVKEDLKFVAEALWEVFLVSGFGAKVSSGFGGAEDAVTGSIQMRATLPSIGDAAAVKPAEPLAKYLAAPGLLLPEYLNADGTFRERRERELGAMKKTDRQTYDKALAWHKKQAAAAPVAKAAPEPEAAPPPAKAAISSFGGLVRVAQEWSAKLQEVS
jgi:CRISPR/Cas system CMR subunit Cmr6 (Cas7 group RAMP superfamily)